MDNVKREKKKNCENIFKFFLWGARRANIEKSVC